MSGPAHVHDTANEPDRRAAPSATLERSAEQAATVSGAILHLQRRAGNRAVAQLLATQRRHAPAPLQRQPEKRRPIAAGGSEERRPIAAGGSEERRPIAAGGGPTLTGAAGSAIATASGPVAPPTEGTEVDRLGVVDNDGYVPPQVRTLALGIKLKVPQPQKEPGLNLRAAPTDQARKLGRLAHNDHVVVKREMEAGWVYLVVTEEKSPLKGATGYAAAMHIEDVPTRDDPDPGAILYRPERDGERAHEFVRRHYGAANIKGGGQDQDFFANVLKYFNDKAGPYYSAHIPTKTVSRPRLWGAVHVSHEDPQLQKGQKIWVPSLDYAVALKGSVGTGRLGRDVWEKVKGFAEKLAAIPAFIAGLVVGALESIKDLFVGLFEMVWQTISTLGKNLVDAGRAIYDLITDSRKRRQLLETIDSELREMLQKGSFLRRAYNWGRIIGYATMEVVSFILLAGATAALKAGKFGARLAKFSEAIKKIPAIQKTVEAANGLRKSEAVAKIAAKLEPAAKVAEKAAAGAKKVVGAVETVTGAPGKAVIATSRVIAKQLRKIAAKYGWSEERLAAAVQIIERRGAKVYLRQSSKWAPARLKQGAIPKPVAIKANTLDELDLILGGDRYMFRRKDLGLVAHYEPVPKEMWRRPGGMSEKQWQALQPQLQAKYEKRAASFKKLEPEMENLTKPTAVKGGQYFEVKGGKVYQVEVTERGGVVKRALAGDIDVLEIRGAAGEPLSRTRGEVEGEYEKLDALFLEAEISEHGPHMDWRSRSDFNEDAFYGILEGHLKDPVVEIGPGGTAREMTADQVPGVAEVLASPEYKAWKARKAAAKAK